jgi:hypothetical protein
MRRRDCNLLNVRGKIFRHEKFQQTTNGGVFDVGVACLPEQRTPWRRIKKAFQTKELVRKAILKWRRRDSNSQPLPCKGRAIQFKTQL